MKIYNSNGALTETTSRASLTFDANLVVYVDGKLLVTLAPSACLVAVHVEEDAVASGLTRLADVEANTCRKEKDSH
ncbi:hypothetical protein NPIL_543761 [Nephila pilipes]|uniref:Uncharacterized protein n=1 Tax=Nephila pilipes TaxID=299642 RepID=A0A8X6UAE1_NEPPI|nr:hypothetical protein NPIL_543761 [Nephila pilipes]